MATPKEAYSPDGQVILGLQRPALNRWRTALDRSLHCHSALPSGGLSRKASPWPPLCHQSPKECPSTSVLAWAGCKHHRLHKEVPGMHLPVSHSQTAITSPWCATPALGAHSNGLLLHEWQVVCIDLWLLQQISFHVSGQNYQFCQSEEPSTLAVHSRRHPRWDHEWQWPSL